MTEARESFVPIVTYWPSSSAMFWWEHFDLNEVRLDFDAATAVQFRHLSVSLTWHHFQPDPDRISSQSLRRLERTLDAAAERGLTLQLILFPVSMGSLLWLPSWTLRPGTSGPRVLAGHHLASTGVRNLFQDPRMVEAETRQVREVVGAFRGHPGVFGWMLGDRVTAASRPESAQSFQEWLAQLVEVARDADHDKPFWYGLSARDLVHSATVDPRLIGQLGVTVDVADDWQPAWAQAPRKWWQAFLAGMASELSGRPAVIANIGRCTNFYGEPPTGSCVNESEAAQEAQEALSFVRDTGGGGVRAASLLDFAPRLQRSPPFDDHPTLLTRGLFWINRTPKESVDPWSRLDRDRLPTLEVPSDFPRVDPEERLQQPESVARDAYQAFVG